MNYGWHRPTWCEVVHNSFVVVIMLMVTAPSEEYIPTVIDFKLCSCRMMGPSYLFTLVRWSVISFWRLRLFPQSILLILTSWRSKFFSAFVVWSGHFRHFRLLGSFRVIYVRFRYSNGVQPLLLGLFLFGGIFRSPFFQSYVLLLKCCIVVQLSALPLLLLCGFLSGLCKWDLDKLGGFLRCVLHKVLSCRALVVDDSIFLWGRALNEEWCKRDHPNCQLCGAYKFF